MPPKTELKDGDFCRVVGGTHAGKSGTATTRWQNPNTSNRNAW